MSDEPMQRMRSRSSSGSGRALRARISHIVARAGSVLAAPQGPARSEWGTFRALPIHPALAARPRDWGGRGTPGATGRPVRTRKIIHVVSCHAAGEVGDVIVGGVAPPPGETLWQQSRWIARDETLRNFVLNEPRGGVFRHVNLLVPPQDPRAQMGWIIMEPADTPPMSGSNSICVATVLLETGILPMTEPETRLVLEAPGGLVEVDADLP